MSTQPDSQPKQRRASVLSPANREAQNRKSTQHEDTQHSRSIHRSTTTTEPKQIEPSHDGHIDICLFDLYVSSVVAVVRLSPTMWGWLLSLRRCPVG